ncbi:glycosyltransferase [Cetobacterium sp.]|uniref:glycosyltransferase n=1 Tax=Cetobacterium sp. TaxID=2071632 RepID=UPI003F3CC2AE
MKKIVHLTMSGKYGGAESVIFNIIKYLRKDYKFVYICPKGNIEEKLKKENVDYLTFSSLNELKKIIKNIKPNNIHAHDFKASVLAAIFSHKNTEIISHLHTDHKWAKKISLKNLLYLLASYRFKSIIFVSKILYNDFKFKIFVSKKAKVLQNTVDKNEIIKKSLEYEVEKNYDLIFLGRLSNYKNPMKFIEIVKKLKEDNLNVKAIIIGDGELKENCKTIIKQFSLESNIDMIGFKDNPFPYLKKSKILIVPSLNEAYGLVVVEANILSKPVLGENIGGLLEVINNKGGFLCSDIDSYVQKIKFLLKKEPCYLEITKKACINSRKFTNNYKFINTINQLYR